MGRDLNGHDWYVLRTTHLTSETSVSTKTMPGPTTRNAFRGALGEKSMVTSSWLKIWMKDQVGGFVFLLLFFPFTVGPVMVIENGQNSE